MSKISNSTTLTIIFPQKVFDFSLRRPERIILFAGLPYGRMIKNFSCHEGKDHFCQAQLQLAILLEVEVELS
jgi:hypothetical protein